MIDDLLIDKFEDQNLFFSAYLNCLQTSKFKPYSTNSTQSRMSGQKPKKAFLKKGTRQFLSNATVRSLSQKPKVIQFVQDNLQNNKFSSYKTINKQFKEEIVIAVKRKNSSQDKQQSANANNKQSAKKDLKISDKSKQNKNDISSEELKTSNSKLQQNSHILSKSNQKKPTLLTDYLGTENKSSKKLVQRPVQQPVQQSIQQFTQQPVQQTSISTLIPKNNVKSSNQQSYQSQVQNLKMQDIDDDSEEESQSIKNNRNSFRQEKNQQNTKKNQISSSSEENFKVQNYKKKPNLLQQAFAVKKQNINTQNKKIDSITQQNQVNFESDSESDQLDGKNQFKSKNNKNLHHNLLKEEIHGDEEQKSSDSESINHKVVIKQAAKPQSKVTQMFNKNNQKSSQVTVQQQISKQQKLAIDDIPKQLIEEIVQKYFKEAKSKYEKKQQNLFEQVKVVEKKQDSLNDQQKILQKRVKQFEKLMQQKNKQFQNKTKADLNKIARQKMYLKDQQTSGKLDWKGKNQIEELKKQLEQERKDRKAVEVKLRGELDRLKTKFCEELEIKRNLEQRIKEYELKEIKQNEIKLKQEKQTRQEMIQKKKNFWEDAPKQTYLNQFYQSGFTLSQFKMEDYLYQQNEFYQYYKQKGESDVLQSEESEGSKLKRTYLNGKVEIESAKKFIKEIFPWGYIIVHYMNGDIKQIIRIPEQTNNFSTQIEIYYAKNNQIIQYSLSQHKKIHYFLANDQIEFTNDLNNSKQIYKANGIVLEKWNSGNLAATFQRNAKGNLIQIF